MVKISGLDSLSRELKDAQKALSELDGAIAEVAFDPNDPASIDRAIHEVEQAVDDRIAPYARNEIVASIADELKENARASILERAAAARLADES